MTQRTLDEWLDYQLRLHALGVDLGLARVREVWQRMGAPPIAPIVITVGGTNGKGSTVAFLEAMLTASGKRVGCYTSPHLLRYNERVRIAGRDVSDAELIDAFEHIEAARLQAAAEPVSLTYFEFGTLAALWIFSQSKLDVAVLEVGLGGRLDAVNIIDADAAIVTTIDLDHQDWLGNDRASIAREKAGIFRSDRPAIIGDADPPPALVDAAAQIGAQLFRAGHEYSFAAAAEGWSWQAPGWNLLLPNPLLAAPVQRANAAAAVAALYALRKRVEVDARALVAGLRSARVAARLQRLHRVGSGDLIVDVAHNPQAARALAQWLSGQTAAGRNFAVFGALSDKDIGGIVTPLVPYFTSWFIGGLDADTPRGLSAADLIARTNAAAVEANMQTHVTIDAALDAALCEANAGDRIFAFGSFFVAAAALSWGERHQFTDMPLAQTVE